MKEQRIESQETRIQTQAVIYMLYNLNFFNLSVPKFTHM